MFSQLPYALLVSALIFAVAAPCAAQDHTAHTHAEATSAPPVVEVAAVDYAIEMPDAIPSGWTTLSFVNDGEEPHFVLFLRMPEGRSFEHYEAEVLPPFMSVWEQLEAGDITQDAAVPMLMEGLPEWYFGVEFMGGAGYSLPGASFDVSVNLEPGNYVLECYMKTSDGDFHAMEGMVRPLVVTEERTEAVPPEATIQVTLSNDGMQIDGDLTPGRHTVSVFYAEHPEMGFPHDVNIARLDADTDIDAVVHWLNWLNLDGLVPPAPADFIGGVRPMPAGHTAYVTLDFEPGRYLFISEYTGALGVLQEVVIAP